MNESLLLSALVMGLIGSLHCAGMCGPIMLILPFQHFSPVRRGGALALYHLGRISVYATMGLVLHSFKSLFHPQWQQGVSLTLGALLLVGGLYSFLVRGNMPSLPWTGWVRRQASRFMGNPSFSAITVAGVLNGLLPCGLVYMALSLAATAPSAPEAALAMYAFGAGTLPMLLSITLLRQRMHFLQGANLRRFVPVMLVAFGGLFLLRGANLGIPYLSPKVEVAADTGEVQSECCHKH